MEAPPPKLTTAQKNLLRAAYLIAPTGEHSNGSVYVAQLRRLVKADYRSIHALGDAGLVEWRAQHGTYTVRGRFGRGGYYPRQWSGVLFKLTNAGCELAKALRIA